MSRLLISLLFLPMVASAGSIQLHTYSHHAKDRNQNEENFGVGYHGDFSVGYYKNSEYEDSFYLGKTVKFGYGFSGTVALVTGYEMGITPMPMLHYRPIDKRVSLMITYAPTRDGGVLLLSIDVRIE